MNRELYNIFKKMPKPANLHIHFSAIISYKRILCMLDNQDLQKNLYLNTKTGNLEYTPTPDLSHKPFDYSVKKNISKIINSDVKNFDTIAKLGAIFFGVIRYKYFFLNYYLPAIPIYMADHHVAYMEIRTKLGSVYDYIDDKMVNVPIIDELHMLYKYHHKFRIIIQFSKCQDNQIIFDRISYIEKLVQNTKLKPFIVAYDLVGDENVCKDLGYFYPTLKKLQNMYHINYYLHAGEILQSNKSNTNIKIAIDLNCKRIGHGINSLYIDGPSMKKIIANNILLEVCPLSNLLFYNYYPNINNIIKYDHNITISSDDDNKTRTNISLEYLFLYNIGIPIMVIKQILSNAFRDKQIKETIHDYDLNKFNDEFSQWYNEYGSKLPPVKKINYQLALNDDC